MLTLSKPPQPSTNQFSFFSGSLHCCTSLLHSFLVFGFLFFVSVDGGQEPCHWGRTIYFHCQIWHCVHVISCLAFVCALEDHGKSGYFTIIHNNLCHRGSSMPMGSGVANWGPCGPWVCWGGCRTQGINWMDLGRTELNVNRLSMWWWLICNGKGPL